ncbi:MAG: alpha-hydroxy-acid oxidizing protein [Pseudomonadota bacterium]|nr:alpha-hydroxy-acid oxidizing protein [Pseudomonadota bacterium]
MTHATIASRRALLRAAAATSAAAAWGSLLPLRSAWAQDLPTVSYPASYALKTPAAMPELYDLIRIEEQARAVMPAGGFGYVAGGAGDEWTLKENQTAFTRRQIVPRVLTGRDTVDMRTTILGAVLASPVIVCPMGGQGLAHPTAEAGSAKGTADAGSLFTLSTVSTLSMEQVARASNGPKWFQLYLMQDQGVSRQLIQRAKAAGYQAIVVTTDTTATGNREADAINKFVFPLQFGNLTSSAGGDIHALNSAFAKRIGPSDIEFVAKESGLPVVVKGVSKGADALTAISAGASAIQISNHGGRQLDGSPATFTVLPEVAKAVNGKVPIILDSGIRRGQDVFRALASGADVVGLGRPVYYGLALGGAQGAQAALQLLNKELAMVMQLAGTPTVADIKKARLL